MKRNEVIKGTPTSIPILTDTNWGNMTLYIDDTAFNLHGWGVEMQLYSTNIFEILPSGEAITLKSNEIPGGVVISRELYDKGTLTKIDLALGRPAVIVPYYTGHRVYRRRGYGAATGDATHEVIVIDKEGNISKETPIMWDYPSISYIEVYYLDETPRTVEGGKLITIANSQSIYGPNYNQATQEDYHNNYIHRGILVTRANTTVKNVKHYIENEITLKEHSEELKTGTAYRGFFYAQNTTNVTFKDCILTSHRCYTKPKSKSKSSSGDGTQGTYDFGANCVNKIVLDGCRQSNFWVTVDNEGKITGYEDYVPGAVPSMAREQVFKNGDVANHPNIWGALMHWGIGGTNYCKNMEYLNSKLSRFDAHAGLYNGKVINSEVNVLALTGMGDFEIKDTKLYVLASDDTYNNLLHLRADYGSTWAGEITMTNFDAYVYSDYEYVLDNPALKPENKVVTHDPFVLMHTYTNWDYGYIATYPSLVFDGVKFYDADAFYKTGESSLLEGLEIVVNCKNHIKESPELHKEITSKESTAYYCYCDIDGDGYVDDYLDEQGKKLPFDKNLSSTYSKGIEKETTRNLNPVKPPDHIKILNSDGSFKLVVSDTSEFSEGGFFGKTKFYYAPDKYYTGTGEAKAEGENVFIFR